MWGMSWEEWRGPTVVGMCDMREGYIFKRKEWEQLHKAKECISNQVPLKKADSWGRLGATDSHTGMCLFCIHWLHGILFFFNVNLAQLRHSREVLGLTTGHGAWHSLRVGGVEGGSAEREGGNWEEGKEWEFGLVIF